MKKRIRAILVLMIICILGINLFQGYWLYTSYGLAYDQFNRSINGALGAALEHKTEMDVRAYLKAHPGADSAEYADTGRVAFMRAGRGPASGGDSFAGPDEAPFRGRLRSSDGDEGEGRFSWSRVSRILLRGVLYDAPLDLQALDSLYRDELEQRDIHAAFVSDTQRFDRSAFRDEAFRRRFFSHEPLETRWVRVDPVRNTYYRASFRTPYGYLFGKMLWLLVGSFALLVLTTWCFIYMLRTILRQKRLSEIKNDFINNMTHELKTPIATVHAAIEALQHFQALEDKSKTRSYLDISRKELQRLSDLVEKVLHVSIEENSEMVLHKEAVDIQELLDHLVERQQLKAGGKAVFQYNHTLDNPVIHVDRMHFTNALNNLIDNAVKYSGERVHITIRCSRDAGRFMLEVADDGMGIPKHYQEHVFEKFFRVPTGDVHNVKGFGLGLNYVRHVVEQHGGSIQLASEAGRGSRFTILLPEDA